MKEKNGVEFDKEELGVRTTHQRRKERIDEHQEHQSFATNLRTLTMSSEGGGRYGSQREEP